MLLSVVVKIDGESGELKRFLALAQLELNDTLNACLNLNLAIELGDEVAIDLQKVHCTE